MATFHVFGIPVTIDFGTDLLEKQNRYEELVEVTNAYDDHPPVEGTPEDEVSRRQISERVDLFYELQSEGVDFSEPEEESASSPWWSRIFG